MGIIAKFFSAMNRPASRATIYDSMKTPARVRPNIAARRALAFSSIQAANMTGASAGWCGTPGSPADENANQEYMLALDQVLRRSQDLDANNPDVHGWNRTRTAQLVGKGVFFKCAPHHDEIGIDLKTCVETCRQIDRVKRLHSRLGGFDSTGHGYSEGKQQERAVLTMFITGRCLLHRVWKYDAETPVPFSLELIPGSRITTPFDKMGDPLVSFGIQYNDPHRSRVVGYWIRHVATSRGNSFVPDFTWDFIPVEDAVLLSLTEMAGLDQALPASLSVMRMLRNRGEMIEQTVECARAQSKFYAFIEAAPGVDPYALASDDRDQTADSLNPDPSTGQLSEDPSGFMNMGGVQALYGQNGQKMLWNNARLPDPDFTGFMEATDSRLARGLVTAKSRFTREVTSSWAGGRMEDQMDDPVIDQLRESFLSAWQKIHAWFIESCWLSGVVHIPNYSTATAAFWTEYRAEFPGKLHINPVDIGNARKLGYELRTLTPQQACAEDGKDLEKNLGQWADAMVMVAAMEKERGLPDGSLAFLLEGKHIDTSAGAETTPTGEPVPADARRDTPQNRIKKYLRNKRRQAQEASA